MCHSHILLPKQALGTCCTLISDSRICDAMTSELSEADQEPGQTWTWPSCWRWNLAASFSSSAVCSYPDLSPTLPPSPAWRSALHAFTLPQQRNTLCWQRWTLELALPTYVPIHVMLIFCMLHSVWLTVAFLRIWTAALSVNLVATPQPPLCHFTPQGINLHQRVLNLVGIYSWVRIPSALHIFYLFSFKHFSSIKKTTESVPKPLWRGGTWASPKLMVVQSWWRLMF